METQSPLDENRFFINVEERTTEDRDIHNRLLITYSRNAKWWYSAFHNVTAMAGAGVLSLPYAMSERGWGPGLTVLVLSWIITLYTLWKMVEMHEMIPRRSLNRYGQYVLSERQLGIWMVVPRQIIVEVGVDIVYMVIGGQSLKKFHGLLCENCKDIKLIYYVMIFASVNLVLSHLPNFNSISGVSLAAAVMSLSYSTIAWDASVKQGMQLHIEYGYKARTTAGTLFIIFSTLADAVFAFAGHNAVLTIQSVMHSTQDIPFKKPMWRVVIVVFLCYFPIALIGYGMFGNALLRNMFLSLEMSTWIIVAMANMFIVVHVIGGYQMYAMPVFDMVETLLVKKLKFKPSWSLRFIARNVYVGFTMFIAMAFLFLSEILPFFGDFSLAPITYFLPYIMWLAIDKPKRFSLSWFINMICIILGAFIMIIALIGGLRHAIFKTKDYKFYS